MSKYRCPWPGCVEPVNQPDSYCPTHWFMIPYDIRMRTDDESWSERYAKVAKWIEENVNRQIVIARPQPAVSVKIDPDRWIRQLSDDTKVEIIRALANSCRFVRTPIDICRKLLTDLKALIEEKANIEIEEKL